LHALPLLPSKNIIGLSATPNRSDGFEYLLYWILGPTSFVYARTPEVTGIRDSVEIKKILFSGGSQFEKAYFNGQLAYAEMTTALTEDCARNDQIIKLLLELQHTEQSFESEQFIKSTAGRKKIIVVSSLVKHCDLLYSEIKKLRPDFQLARMAGPNVETILAKDPKTHIVFATYSMLEEGYDDPVLDTLVLCTPRSRIQQTIGRIERTMDGKLKPLVIDIVDNFSIYPSMWYKRKRFYNSRGFFLN
jgi:superfamily II DNA or RNA helicase